MSLATKYRPQNWEDVVEQSATKTILQNQLDTGEIKNAYLFCGGAGTGKTTCARIFANKINKGIGSPIEMDAASNNSVDDVRLLLDKARSSSLEGEYKVFILDEVHALSNSAWQAMLKILEEPPKKSIFILCTTDPQKIPNTILSRVQRYDFKRISQSGIINRLAVILSEENLGSDTEEEHITRMIALEYIAKLADGGMRDAITMLDKCLAFNKDLTLDNVMKALGTSNIETMVNLYNSVFTGNIQDIVSIVDSIHAEGKDLKLFIRQFTDYILDINKLYMLGDFTYTKLPNIPLISGLLEESEEYFTTSLDFLDELIKLGVAIKWDNSPKSVIEATFISFSRRNKA